jgi:hypothetical protein
MVDWELARYGMLTVDMTTDVLMGALLHTEKLTHFSPFTLVYTLRTIDHF